jgi:hypothetical protein
VAETPLFETWTSDPFDLMIVSHAKSNGFAPLITPDEKTSAITRRLSGNLAVMPTPFESAQLILTLYDQRREEKLRSAREFFGSFDPQTADEFMAASFGPQGAFVRMVIGYWDMACSLVQNGAIDHKMFADATGEYLFVYVKIAPLIPALREKFSNPNFCIHLEQFVHALPDAKAQIDAMTARMATMRAMRQAAAGKA